MTDRVWRERALRDAVAGGDAAAWRAWYAAEYGPLEAYVVWRCGSSRDLADDVLQETWLTAVKAIRRFEPEAGAFHNWLCGIAGNVLRNQLRSRRRRASREEPLASDPGKAACGFAGERVAEALAALPERSERVLRMN